MEVTCSVGARSETEYEHPLIQSFSAAAAVLAIWLRMLFRGHLARRLCPSRLLDPLMSGVVASYILHPLL